MSETAEKPRWVTLTCLRCEKSECVPNWFDTTAAQVHGTCDECLNQDKDEWLNSSPKDHTNEQ